MTTASIQHTSPDQSPELYFDRFRYPCSEAERDSLRDYQNVNLFLDVFEATLNIGGVELTSLYPKVMIDTTSNEIGLMFFQAPITTKTGRYSNSKFSKAFDRWGNDLYVFVSSSGVTQVTESHVKLIFKDERDAAVIGGMFAAGVLTKQPIMFPECPHCSEGD